MYMANNTWVFHRSKQVECWTIDRDLCEVMGHLAAAGGKSSVSRQLEMLEMCFFSSGSFRRMVLYGIVWFEDKPDL